MFTSKTVGEMHHKDLLKTLHTLKDHDIPPDQLQRIPWIMAHTSGGGERDHERQRNNGKRKTMGEKIVLSYSYFTTILHNGSVAMSIIIPPP